ncbi:MAG: hypothetical protein WCJ60_02525 [bacterium]
MKKSKSSKNKAWFVSVRGSYLPNSWQGWLLYVPFVAFLLSAMSYSMDNKHSTSDVVYAIFPQWVAAAVVMTWIAKSKTK